MKASDIKLLADQLMRKHLEDAGMWGFTFSILDHAIAATDFQTNCIFFNSFYLKYLSLADAEHIILHEIAHVLAGVNASHGEDWQDKCRGLNINDTEYFKPPQFSAIEWEKIVINAREAYDRRQPKTMHSR